MAKVREYFARWRIDAFAAGAVIEPTREWERVIETALASCDALAALFTPGFVSSEWCDQEVGYCLARNVPIVHRFAASTNFPGARANFALLGEIAPDAWTRELVDIAERAEHDNDQISRVDVLDPPRLMPEVLAELLAPIRRKLGMNEPAPVGDDIPF